MSFFCEHPWRLVLTGVAVVVTCLLMGRTTGYRPWYVAAFAMILVCCGLLVWERRIITLPEAIAAKLDEMAADLETNQVETVLRHVSKTRPDLQQQTRQLLPRYEIHRARVKSNLRVDRVAVEGREVVRARFNAVFQASETRGDIRNLLSPWYFVVDFVEEDGTWRVERYERHDPRKGMVGQH